MEIPLTAENLSKPWFRAVIGIILVIAGFFFTDADGVYKDVTRESCVEGEGTLYDLRVDSLKGNTIRGMWLIFDDYEQSLTIHASCSSDELISTMYKLKKDKTKLSFVHATDNGCIYELWANGEKLLDFETSKEKINNNVSLIKYVGYAFIPLGAVLFLTSFIKFKKKGTDAQS